MARKLARKLARDFLCQLNCPPEHRLVGRVDPGEDGVPGDLGVARVRLDDRGDSLEQVQVLRNHECGTADVWSQNIETPAYSNISCCFVFVVHIDINVGFKQN